MNTLRLLLVGVLLLGSTSCIPAWDDSFTRRGPEDFEVTGSLTRTTADCSTTYELSNVGDAAPSCYKCEKFETGSNDTAALAFVLSPRVSESDCQPPLALGSTPIGFSSAESGGANVHLFDWTEPKSFAAWKDIGAGTWEGDPYIGQVVAGDLSDPVTGADRLELDMSWSVDEKLSRALPVCATYDGEDTEVPYSWLGDGDCDPALECALYSWDAGDCDPLGAGDDDDSVDPPTCQDDEYEDNDDNDEPTALQGDGVVTGLRACAGDHDWFVLPVDAGQQVQVELGFVHAAGDIDVRLLDRDLVDVAEGAGTSGDDNESLVWTATQTGPVFVHVYLYKADPSPGNTYDLRAWAN